MTRPALIALDVDGTSLTPEHRVTPRLTRAVRTARRLGTRVVLASSRAPSGLLPVQEQLGLAHAWFVAFQGALVGRRQCDSGDLLTLERARIPLADATEVVAHARGLGLSPSWYAGSSYYGLVLDAAVRRSARITGEAVTEATVRASAARDGSPYKLLVVAGEDRLRPALEELRARLPSTLAGVHSHPDFLEVTVSGVDKGTGLRLLAEALQVRLEDCAVIGDGANDLPMFAVAGTAVAMGQASPVVQDAASWVTHDNTRDGAAHAVEVLVAGTEEES